MTPAQPQRMFYEGIDLARASAVILVLWSHAVVLAPPWAVPILFPDLFRPGFWGISIFYAISGFLVGSQVLEILASQRRGEVLRFLLRRWLRTVPTYWIILVGLLLLGSFSWPGAVSFAANLLFVAFPGGAHSPLLPVTWTLVIEEWSYLALALLSLVMLAWRGSADPRRLGRCLLGVVIVWILIACLSRYATALTGVTVVEFKKNPFAQLDALAFGFGLALLRTHAAERFSALLAAVHRWCWLPALGMTVLGVAGSALFREHLKPLPVDQGLWLSFVFYPLAGFLSCAFLLSLWPFRYARLPAFAAQGLRIVSRASYSIYLLHVPLRAFVFDGHIGFVPLALYVLASVVVGWLFWLLVEVPFIRLRHRF